MTVVTLTELNQHPSRVARMAETEPVFIRRYGRDYLVLRRDEPADDPLAALRAAGLLRPAKNPHPDGPPPSMNLTAEEAEALYDDFLASRSGR